MRLKDLLNSCQNQWLNSGFKRNPLFTIHLLFEDRSVKEFESVYIIKGDYIDDVNYLMKYRFREVKYWFMIGTNDIKIEIEGHY